MSRTNKLRLKWMCEGYFLTIKVWGLRSFPIYTQVAHKHAQTETI